MHFLLSSSMLNARLELWKGVCGFWYSCILLLSLAYMSRVQVCSATDPTSEFQSCASFGPPSDSYCRRLHGGVVVLQGKLAGNKTHDSWYIYKIMSRN